jgi:guanine nucleotide-binding protein G(i) subunit alpha
VSAIHLFSQKSVIYVDTNSFFSEAQRIVAEEYVPSIEDILHAAEKGIEETYFKMDQTSIRVLQVCGQEGERKKWIHLFGSITSIIFYASLSDYDEKAAGWSEEVCLLPMLTMYVTKRLQTRVTRLAESLARFEADVNSRWFLRTSVILVLSDMSKFRTKIYEVH